MDVGQLEREHMQMTTNTRPREVKAIVGKFGLIPAGRETTSIVWKKSWFKKYGLGAKKEYAVCTLCIEEGRWDIAEVKYGRSKSPTNLINHLDSDEHPRHRERHNLNRGNSDTSGPNDVFLLSFRDCVDFKMGHEERRSIPPQSRQNLTII